MKTLEPLPPHIEGPSWRRYTDGSWYLPEKSLAWGLVDWFVEYLRSPDGEGEFWPTQEQMRFLLWMYAVNDDGSYKYRNLNLRRCKGWGKDPLAAALSLAELCGPVAFSHFDAKGEPVGKQRFAPWVQIVSTTWDNTKNAMMLFPALVTDKLKKEHKLELNKTVIYSGAGGRIESCTSSPYALEGNRPTLVICNETQWWKDANGGHDLQQVINGNVTKVKGARKLSICNAHVPGEDSVAERDHEAYQLVKSGQAIDVGTLYDSLEAPPGTPISEIPFPDVDPEGYAQGIKMLERGIEVARGDSVWLPVDAVLAAILDVRNPVSESRRKHLNQLIATEDAFVSPQEWDECAVLSEAMELKPGDKVTLAFDGSKSNDWSALAACRIEDGHIQLLKAWDPEKQPGKEINREDIDDAVRAAFATYDVVGFRADIYGFESYVDQWSRDFKKTLKIGSRPGKIVDYDMRGHQKGFALDCERFLDAVLAQALTHNGDTTLRRHVMNCRRHALPSGLLSVRKESRDSSRKIDAAVTAIMAFGQRHEYLMSKRGSRTGKAVIIQ